MPEKPARPTFHREALGRELGWSAKVTTRAFLSGVLAMHTLQQNPSWRTAFRRAGTGRVRARSTPAGKSVLHCTPGTPLNSQHFSLELAPVIMAQPPLTTVSQSLHSIALTSAPQPTGAPEAARRSPASRPEWETLEDRDSTARQPGHPASERVSWQANTMFMPLFCPIWLPCRDHIRIIPASPTCTGVNERWNHPWQTWNNKQVWYV